MDLMPGFSSKNLILENGYIRLKQCRHGLLLYNRYDTFIGKSLDLYGEWCEKELELLDQIILMGDVVIDIGANIGTHTVFFANKVKPSGKVIAFEPQRLSFQMLCGNIALNGLKIVESRQEAVGDKKKEVIVPVIPPETKINFGSISLLDQHNGEKVPCIKLDDLKLSRCDLLKIDVEGYESLVLEGASRIINQLKPIIFIENNREENSLKIIQFLLNHSYQCWWHFCRYYNSENFFHHSENVFFNCIEANLICFPKDHPALLEFDVKELLPIAGIEDTYQLALKRFYSKNEKKRESKSF